MVCVGFGLSLGAVVDKKRVKDQPCSGRKIGANLQTVALLVRVSGDFLGMDLLPNNIYETNIG